MRSSTIIMVVIAAVFGLLAVFVAQSWLNSQATARLKNLEAQNKIKPIAGQTIVVASKPLRFGAELSASVLKEIPWAEDTLPNGAFKTVAQLTSEKHRVLTAIEASEPVLASKITGAGQRATLSSVIKEGHKAVTIRVNDVEGVAGFILPADHVDVILSRRLEKNEAVNDVVLKNVRVLAIDQLADERSEKPAVAKAVTLEVDIDGAQKLALASQVGTLSLALRQAGDTEANDTRSITLADLLNSKSGNDTKRADNYTTISIVRSQKKSVYSVPKETVDNQSMVEMETGPLTDAR